MGTQGIATVWMLTPHYDAFRCSPMLTFATKKLSTEHKDKRRKPNSPFVCAVLIELSWSRSTAAVVWAPAAAMLP